MSSVMWHHYDITIVNSTLTSTVPVKNVMKDCSVLRVLCIMRRERNLWYSETVAKKEKIFKPIEKT